MPDTQPRYGQCPQCGRTVPVDRDGLARPQPNRAGGPHEAKPIRQEHGMKDINGREIRPGQRVRWTQVIEAEVEQLGSTRPGVYLRGAFYTLEADGTSIEVLAEPRIPEPRNLGAVVEASTASNSRRREFFRDHQGRWWDDREVRLDWPYLIDPVLLSEGWTDGE